MMLKPIPEYFRVAHTGTEKLLAATNVVGTEVGVLPHTRDAAFVEEVFGSMFQLFPFETVLLARNFKKLVLKDITVYWNTELRAGYMQSNVTTDCLKDEGWLLPVNRKTM